MAKCPYCQRPLAGEICPVHGYVGAGKDAVEKVIGLVPIGGIILYDGLITNIPKNWALCDGTKGTPNLREKFIIGAGTTAIGTTGGSNAGHTHSVPSLSVAAGGNSTSGLSVALDHSGTAVGDHATEATSTHTGQTGTTSGPSDSTGNLTTTGSASRASTTHTHTFNDGNHLHQVSAMTHNVTNPSSHGQHDHTIGFDSTGTTGTGTTGGASVFPVAYYYLAYIKRIS